MAEIATSSLPVAVLHLLRKAAQLSIESMSTSALAIGGGLLIFGLVLWRKWRLQGKETVLKEWRGELGFVAVLTVGWWICLLAFWTSKSVWDDHGRFVSANATLLAKNKKLQHENEKISQERDNWKTKAEQATQGRIDSDRPIAAKLTILYGNQLLNGQRLNKAFQPNSSSFTLAPIEARNDGSSTTGRALTFRLYFSVEVQSATMGAGTWQSIGSDDSEFRSQAYWGPSAEPLSIGETWQTPMFVGNVDRTKIPLTGIKTKLRVFYGANGPAEVTFYIPQP